MSSSSISSASKPLPRVPVQAVNPQDKIDLKVAAKKSVWKWETENATKSYYVRMTVASLIRQLDQDKTELLVDRPDTPEQGKYISQLQLPEGYSFRYLDKVQDSSASSGSSSPRSLDPYSPDRSYFPQGGMARVPLVSLASNQVDDLKNLMLKFFKDVEANRPGDKRNPVLVEQLVAHTRSQADPESYLFEMAAQLADHAKYYGNRGPLNVMLKHLPAMQWRELFEFDLEKKDEWPDPRSIRGAVTRSLAEFQPHAAQPQAGENLAAAGNHYILAVAQEPGNPVAAAEVLVKKIRKAHSSKEGQGKAIERMFLQLNDACARAQTNELGPMYAFVSTLEPHFREIYSQRLPAKPVSQSDKLIDKLVAPNSSVMKGEFEKFAQSRNAILTMIAGVAKRDKSEAAQLQSKLDFAVTGVARGWIRDLGSRDSPLHQNDFKAFQLALVRVTGLIGRLDEASQDAMVNELNQTLEKLATTVPAHAQAVRDLKL